MSAINRTATTQIFFLFHRWALIVLTVPNHFKIQCMIRILHMNFGFRNNDRWELKNVKIFGRRKCLKKTDTFIVSWCCSCGRGIFAGVFTQIFHINSDELNYFCRILKIALCLFQFHLIVLNSHSFSLWLHSCKFCL